MAVEQIKFGQVAGSNNVNAEDRPQAQVWINVGYMHTDKNPETGEVQEIFIGLPMGIPVDTMKRKPVSGSSHLYKVMMQGKNDLLDKIDEIATELKPGEERLIGGQKGGLLIQLRRREAQDDVAPEDNPLVSTLSSVKFGIVS